MQRSIGTFCLASVCLATALQADDRIVNDFNSANSAKQWRAVNDGVMGGRSDGRFRMSDDGFMQFFGTLSLENNGGFASVRVMRERIGLKDGDVIVARVRGDGREYKFNVYAARGLGGYSYRQSFRTKADQWIEVEFPVSKFKATWRGRTFPNQRLDASQVVGWGFLLGDKKPGPFQLDIDWIKIRSKDSE